MTIAENFEPGSLPPFLAAKMLAARKSAQENGRCTRAYDADGNVADIKFWGCDQRRDEYMNKIRAAGWRVEIVGADE